MIGKKITTSFLVLMCLSLLQNITFGASLESSETENQEYKQELNRIKSLGKSFTPGPTNDLKSFERLANEIQSKWSQKKKEYYARLMLEVCEPLSSGRFNDERQYDVARRYALSALAESNKIPLEVELELTGHIMTDTVTPRAPTGQEWAKRQKQDVEVRFHAWRRLIDAIDPNWDPNDIQFYINVPLPSGVEGEAGVSPDSVKDPKLRAEYEAAIKKNREKAERYSEQNRLHKWLKRFPKRAEEYIIQAYSKPPFDVEELKQYLDKYIADTKTKARILDAVTKNMQEQAEKIPKQ